MAKYLEMNCLKIGQNISTDGAAFAKEELRRSGTECTSHIFVIIVGFGFGVQIGAEIKENTL